MYSFPSLSTDGSIRSYSHPSFTVLLNPIQIPIHFVKVACHSPGLCMCILFNSLTLRLLMFYIYIYIYIYMERLFLMFLDHTQQRSTVGRTPLDE